MNLKSLLSTGSVLLVLNPAWAIAESLGEPLVLEQRPFPNLEDSGQSPQGVEAFPSMAQLEAGIVSESSPQTTLETYPGVAELRATTPILTTPTEQTVPESADPNQNDPIKHPIFSDEAMGQLTSVAQLRDVEPTDWAFEALRSLVEQYGCIVGYPDSTFKGDQAISRYEFAAGLNACLTYMERLIQENVQLLRDDLDLLKRLAKEFEVELANLGARIDNLESRVAFLEDHQFSTTVTMNGEVIFALSQAFGGNPPGGCTVLPDNSIGGGDVNDDPDVDCRDPDNPDNNTTFNYLARIGLQSSFTGKDRLRMFLTTGNFDNGGFTSPESFNTYGPRFSFQAGLENQVFLDILEYRFPVLNDRVALYAAPFGFALSNVLTANSPYFDIGRGAISRFGQLNPILRIGGPLDAGVGFDWLIADPVRLQFAYGTRDSSDPNGGFFGADQSTLGTQFLIQPSENTLLGINYVNSYSQDGSLGTFTGSVNAETLGLWSQAGIPASDSVGPPPSGFGCCPLPVGDFPAQINAVGGSFQWRLADNLTFGAWGGYIFANFLDRLPNDPALGDSANKKPFANAATFTTSLGLSDPFGREGDLVAFIFGMPPKLVDAGPSTVGVPVPFFEQVLSNEPPTPVTDNNPNILNGPQTVGAPDEATSLHFEFFYRFRVTDNIWITPGFFFVTNPGHIEENETIYVGTVRTTFRF